MPGDTFIYKFLVDRVSTRNFDWPITKIFFAFLSDQYLFVFCLQSGTYIYHAHYGMQRSAGLYGMIKVAVRNGVVEPFAYDYDRSFIFNDWWHKSTYELATGLASIPFVFVGEPQVLLRIYGTASSIVFISWLA